MTTRDIQETRGRGQQNKKKRDHEASCIPSLHTTKSSQFYPKHLSPRSHYPHSSCLKTQNLTGAWGVGETFAQHLNTLLLKQEHIPTTCLIAKSVLWPHGTNSKKVKGEGHTKPPPLRVKADNFSHSSALP